jgi:hypothetical protein
MINHCQMENYLEKQKNTTFDENYSKTMFC